MHKSVRQPTVIFLSISFFVGVFLLAGCNPKSNTQTQTDTPAPTEEIKFENVEVIPTVSKAIAQNGIYQVPKKIVNNDKVEIILGETELQNTKASYSSAEGKMVITGQVVITNNTKKNLAKKYFSLSGVHTRELTHFSLHDKLSEQSDPIVKAEARCLNVNSNGSIDCNHVLVDVYVLFNDKYYTEQIEVNRVKSKTPAPLANTIGSTPEGSGETEVFASPAEDEEVPLQDETADQILTQQTEAVDDSVDGRYQGGAETIDLVKLFQKKIDQAKTETTETIKTTPSEGKSVEAVSTVHKEVVSKKEVVHKEENKNAKKNSVNESAVVAEAKEKPLSSDLLQTKSGEIRPTNQAFGFPEEGYLRNATSVLTRQQALNKKAYFEVVSPDRKKHFTTFEMAEIITKIGEYLNKLYSKVLYVSNLSAAQGGKLAPHASHQNGLDADLAYPTDINNLKFPLVVRMKTREYFPNNYSLEKTYNLFKFLYTQKEVTVDRIFVDKTIIKALCNYAKTNNELKEENISILRTMSENIQHVDGHGDHFHVRIKCSKLDPGCRGRIYKKVVNCGSIPGKLP